MLNRLGNKSTWIYEQESGKKLEKSFWSCWCKPRREIPYEKLPGASRGVPTHNKVMWESFGGQGKPDLEGCPSGAAWASTPKPESAYFTALCSHLHLWLYGGPSPTTISPSEKELTYSSS